MGAFEKWKVLLEGEGIHVEKRIESVHSRYLEREKVPEDPATVQMYTDIFFLHFVKARRGAKRMSGIAKSVGIRRSVVEAMKRVAVGIPEERRAGASADMGIYSSTVDYRKYTDSILGLSGQEN
jgi:hypothetical protein